MNDFTAVQAEGLPLATGQAQGRAGPDGLRASDAERDAVAATLADHFREGRLNREELDERLGRALTARTRGELGAVLADLPDGPERADGGARRPAGAARGGSRFPALPMAALAVIVAAFAVATAVHGGRPFWFPWWLVIVTGLIVRRRLLGRATPRSRR
jgi:hypothetical protein